MEDGNTRQLFSSVLCLSGEIRYIVFQNSTPQKIANLRQTREVEIRVVNCTIQRESYLLGGQCKTWTADWV